MNLFNEQRPLLTNLAIGFFSVLLLLFVIALIGRFAIPRITAERGDDNSTLIGNVIQVEVLNGCGISGAATTMTNSLRKYGFDVVEIGNFDHFDVQKTLVISRNGNMASARQAARALGISEDQILREESPDFYLDLTIVIGTDYTNLNL